MKRYEVMLSINAATNTTLWTKNKMDLSEFGEHSRHYMYIVLTLRNLLAGYPSVRYPRLKI